VFTVDGLDTRQLLEKFNPFLAILPQDFSRPRPYQPWFTRSKAPRGDYHPCTAEFFLSYVLVRTDGARQYGRGNPSHATPLGLEELRKLVARTDPNATFDWEIDIAPIESQKPARAWPAYAKMVEEYYGVSPFECVVHARAVPCGDHIALQYWYLYGYNDAGNYHEGDWEMVTLDLDAGGTPLRAGYSGHESGFQRPWERIQKKDGRPIVYVARGSHAAYFEHKKDGHRTKSLPNHKGLPWLIDLLVRRIQKAIIDVIVFFRWNDHTATHPDYPGDEPWNQGVFVLPRVVELIPIDQVTPDGPHWWMRIQCRWGSRHARLRGTAAPSPAWEQADSYDDPIVWIDGLDPGRG